MARPSKLTPALQKKIVGLIREGNFAARAAAACGISESTFYNWCRDGRDALAKYQEGGAKLTQDEQRKMAFLVSIKEAEALAEAQALEVIQKAAHTGTWQAAAWYLERKHGARWLKKEQIEATIHDGAEKKTKKTQEELLEELQKLEQEGR